jgi:uncharacterized membrane protein
MFPDPLHPAIVHFPIVLATLAPLVAAAAFWAIHSERLPRRAWIGVIVLQIVLVGSAWVATETGEHEEDRAEAVVAERHIEEHEEAAERFLALAALVLPLAAAGLLAGPVGTINQALTVALCLAALAAVTATGRSGGELVYRHGAAAAYEQTGSGEADSAMDYAARAEQRGSRKDRHHDNDEDSDD